jgi:hypothetical protein
VHTGWKRRSREDRVQPHRLRASRPKTAVANGLQAREFESIRVKTTRSAKSCFESRFKR